MSSRGESDFHLIGRLTRDPETSYTSSGMLIMNFSIAVGKKRGDQEHTSFFNCVMFGKYAEAMSQHLKKGLLVSLKGELKQERWVDRSTQLTRSRIVCIVNKVLMLSFPKESTQPASQPQNQNTNSQPGVVEDPWANTPDPPTAEEFDDDIPF